MSVIAGVAKVAAAAKMLTGTSPTTTRVFPKRNWTLVVIALALLALVAFAVLIPASQAPSAEHYSAGNMADQSAALVSQPPMPQMSKKEAIDAYEKLPLSFIPNEGQTDKAVRYYAQGAGYGFFFTHKGARLSFANGEGHGGHALALDFLERVMNSIRKSLGM